MGSRADKDRLFDAFASIGKASSSGRRVELVDVLAQGRRSVEQLASEIGQSVANTSAHLQVLAGAGLVRSDRDGNRVIYRVSGPSVEGLWSTLRTTASDHLLALDQLAGAYLGDRGNLATVTRSHLVERLLQDDSPVVLDVRPPAEYLAGHIPGAVSVPPDELAERLRHVPRDRDVVAYCRGPYCAYADDAVRQLQKRRFRAGRLEDGFPEWRLADLPVAVGAEPGTLR
jgi:rhodanese-related sulfurtransferase